MKYGKCEFPPGKSAGDFTCFGPAATKDDEFEGTFIADLGCFNVDSGVDSNKRYHGCVCEANGTFYFYTEWTRTGNANAQFQFEPCASKDEAQRKYVKQMKSKNIGRGSWEKITGLTAPVLRPKIKSNGKPYDLYLVRPLNKRTSGLPDGQNILAGSIPATAKAPVKAAKSKKSVRQADSQTMKLLSDMSGGVQSYVRATIVGGDVPSQEAIDSARDILAAALKRTGKIAERNQPGDSELGALTKLIYSMVPKVKERGVAAIDYVLTSSNIGLWNSDLDAFESAGHVAATTVAPTVDPYGGMNITMTWLSPSSPAGEMIRAWMPKSTANRHSWVGAMKIKNVWQVERHGVAAKFHDVQNRIIGDKPRITERALFQPKIRADLNATQQRDFLKSNTAMLFHGTRSVNVLGIMREGLRLPKQLVGVAITGAMFGPGHYWADDWKKSAGYTSLTGSYYSSGSGGVRGRGAFMFVADVALGKLFVAPGPSGYTSPPRGHDAVYGKAGHSHVQNNEFITYDNNQNQLSFLVEFETN